MNELEKLIAELEKRDAAMAATITDQIQPIQKSLDSLNERDTSAGDQKVKELEAKLVDGEQKLEQMREDQRQFMLSVNTNRPDALPESRVNLNGCNFFIKDVAKLKAGIADARAGNPGQLDAATGADMFPAGEMPPEVANSFIDLAEESAPTLGLATTLRQTANARNIDELRLGQRTMRGQSAELAAVSAPSGVTAARRTTSCVVNILTEDFSLDFLEDNIAQGAAEGQIAGKMIRSFGQQQNDLGWNGRDASSDAFLTLNDGWIALMVADGDVTDLDLASPAAATAEECFGFSFKALLAADARLASLLTLTYFCPPALAQTYAEEVAARETASSDDIQLNGFPNLRYFGRRVVPEPDFSESAVSESDTADSVVLTPADNLHWAVQRQLRVDSEWVPRNQMFQYTLAARTDFEYSTGRAIVKSVNVPAAFL